MHNSIAGVVHSKGLHGLVTSSLALATTVVILPLCAGNALAEVKFIPHANAGYEYNSNLFQVNENDPNPLTPRLDSKGERRLSDTSMSYGGGLDINGTWGEQKAGLTTSIVRSVYDHFDQLNRNDQLFGLGIDWIATRKISGSITARYDEHLTPFTELADPAATGAQSSLTEIDRVVGLSGNYAITSKWTGMTSVGYSRRSVPDGNGGSYDLQQVPKTVGIRYGGAAKVAVSLNIDKNDGKYVGAGNVPGFHSTRYQSTVDYTFSPRTNLSANFGYTQFTQAGIDSDANVGGITFNQQLTEKTKYYLRYNRALDVYPTTQGSQLSSTGAGGLSWQALRKVGLSADYSVAKSTVKSNVALPGVTVGSREDTLKSTQAAINYGMLPWLNISTYYRYQERTSEVTNFEFHNKVYGVTLDVRYQ